MRVSGAPTLNSGEKNESLRSLPWAWLAAAYVLVELIYRRFGIRYDDQILRHGWQYLDPQLLKNDLVRSLLYLHTQPPLYNLYLGMVLKLAPAHSALLFSAISLVVGFTLYCALYLLMRYLGVSRWLAYLIATVFVISPSFVLYQNLLFYAFPVTCILCVSAVLFYRFVKTQDLRTGVALFGATFILCGTWSLYHWIYFVLLAGGLCLLSRIPKKTIVAAAICPFVCLMLLYAKNAVIFREFSVCSWTGMNQAIQVCGNSPLPLRQKLIREGHISALSLCFPFSSLTDLRQYANVPVIHSSIPAMDEEIKSTGQPNYNNLAYINVSNTYAHDSLYLIRHFPKYYIHDIVKAWRIYFLPTDHYPQLSTNTVHIESWETAFQRIVYGCVGHRSSHICWFVLVALPVSLGYGLYQALKGGRSGTELDSSRRLLLLYLCGNILYLAFVSTTINMVETHRMRFSTDPFLLALIGFCLENLVVQRLMPGRRVKSVAESPVLVAAEASNV